MAKIEKLFNSFKPYNLTIESRTEHAFLEGLFAASPIKQKDKCRHYNEEIERLLYNLITKAQE
ncbi:unnamed protein product [marine sediment metagenome]|uniref:Uncharacterized protein n=1 Tax=marine sediment metagenome TaxID=412755 RepID=X0W0S7_9ZZZZ